MIKGSHSKKVSIIIINYNTLSLTRNCINSIFKCIKDQSFEIIVVDNASTDGSKEFFGEFKNIIYIYLNKNIGFGSANNIGAQYSNGEYLLFLNSDTIIKNNILYYFLKFYEISPNNRICLGSYLKNNCDEWTHSYDRFPTIRGQLLKYLLLPFNHKVRKPSKILASISVDYIIGADLFIPKSIFLEIGGFDEDFFLYFEETDLQLRLKDIGVERSIISGPEIIHLEGASSGKEFREKKFFWPIYSSFIYFYKHRKKFQYLIYRILSLIILVHYIIIIKTKEGKKNYLKTLFARIMSI